jgi:hypothetical protein
MSLIKFTSLEDFYLSKNLLSHELMELMGKLALHAQQHPVPTNLVWYDGTCTASNYTADDLHTALMRYTKNNMKLSEKLTTKFLFSIDTCLLAFFLVIPYRQELGHIEDTELINADVDLRISNTELLMMLLRQVVLKMTRFDGIQYKAFSLTYQFTPIRFCNPISISSEVTNSIPTVVELNGPFGSKYVIKNNDPILQDWDDIIVEVPTLHVQDMFLALAMGTHDRLGAGSLLQGLHVDVLGLVGKLTMELF